MSGRAIGEVRPSQVITTFGPGAIVDLEHTSVIVGGIDNWRVRDDLKIREPRLERALRVKKFFSPEASEGKGSRREGTIPTYIFPRFQFCPVCFNLAEIGSKDLDFDSKWGAIQCKAPHCSGRGKFRARTLPAPFVVACVSGHLDDFPWRRYLHRGDTECRERMTIEPIGKTGSVSDLWLRCACGKKRSVGEAFGENASKELERCTRRRPWLGPRNHDNDCAESPKALQRGATNAWFPIVRSALKIGDYASPIGMALESCLPYQLDKIDTLEKLSKLVEDGFFPSLEGLDLEDVWGVILRQRRDEVSELLDLKLPEWQVFCGGSSAGQGNRSEFLLAEVPSVPMTRALGLRLVLARRLVEVRALTSFSRIEYASIAAGEGESSDLGSPIYASRPDWLPAVEVRGEGIFIQLDEALVTLWEEREAVRERAKAMAETFAAWQADRGKTDTEFPGARYVLLHSLAHVLIRQLALDCGYSAASVRERIYSNIETRRRMAGILLYTASADSDGSLGGLVDLGTVDRFPGLLRNALLGATRCSSDPLCADHQPDVHATINGAACHSCMLAPESSCEGFNMFLDRGMLVPTLAHGDLAFFPDPFDMEF